MNEKPLATVSIQQLLEDPICKQFMNAELIQIHNDREKLLKGHPGGRLRSHPVGHLQMAGLYNYEDLSEEYLLILHKKSTLSSELRQWIKLFVGGVINKVLKHYETKYEPVIKAQDAMQSE